MYLKSIEVQGFKSFANKTVFQFQNGITGIVGPNGSGKSNVADAVRWVLGEQRVKQLRGGSMQDVIFAGTQSRRPLGYASVAITLDNSDHMLPVDFDEVTVSRRLYRSGESEYLINGTACRLKDISEMFYDTGIGKEGYSIIGQGQIDKILSGKPEERRELFDEAAGIVKFKRRKLETLRKLENEQQNLLRVNDILAELTRQLGPLERQSEKAKIYLRKKEELKAYDVNLFLSDMEEIRQRQEETRKNAESARSELDEVNAEIEKIRSGYEETSAMIEDLDAQQKALAERISEDRLSQQQEQSRIEVITEQIRGEGERKAQRERRQKTISLEIGKRKEMALETAQGISALKEETARTADEEVKKKTEHDVLLSQIAKTDKDMEESHDEQIRLLNERTAIRTRQQHYDTMLEQISIQKAQISGQILELKTRQNARDEELSGLEAVCADLADRIAVLSSESEDLNAQLMQEQEALAGQNQKMEHDQVEYHREASRLESLKNIAERYDGYGSSIRHVMDQRKKVKGIHGVVADLIKTKKDYETAIETALGGSIQNIVTDNEETAKQMIEYLKQNKYGRATFLPLTAMRRSEPFKQVGALNEKGVIGLASTLVQTAAAYAPLTSYLLGRTLVVDQIDHAVALARKYKYSMRIVTLEGELLSPGGSMTGGAFKNSSNLLGRRREIEELEKSVKKSGEELENLRNEIDKTRDRRNALRDRIRECSEKLQKLYLEKNTADTKLSEMRKEKEELEHTRQTFLSRNQQADEQMEDITRDKEEIARQLSLSKEQEGTLKDTEDGMRTLSARLKADEESLREILGEIRVKMVSLEEKKDYLEREEERYRQEEDQLEKEREALQEEQKQADQELTRMKKEISERKEVLKELAAKTEENEKEAAALQEKRNSIAGKQKTIFDRREDLLSRSSLLDREVYRLEGQLERMEENKESRITYMWDEYELTWSQAQALKRDDLGSKSNWRRSMNSLRGEIRELGNVNVNAIDEYKEISERHAFMSSQQEDLVKAEEALRKIIQKLDTSMRAQFKEQFARIQEEFDKSFKHLFGGGTGTLELVEEEDILEAGIRIIAQPPGKKLQNMMQLSGGEKSLTAIALLFAIQNLKPSPFCLLDEIEAALDESNVDRYAAYLHKLTKHTQFIIITHRRGTMTAADRLYGVTMQEKGISALVSVDLIEGELDS